MRRCIPGGSSHFPLAYLVFGPSGRIHRRWRILAHKCSTDETGRQVGPAVRDILGCGYRRGAEDLFRAKGVEGIGQNATEPISPQDAKRSAG